MAEHDRDSTPVSQRLGPYLLRERLGEGGMGVVYRASRDDGDDVAIKVLRPHIAHDPDARRRLSREVQTLSRVHHPNVAAVLDADVDGPAPYVVTEYVPGIPLDDLVAERGPLRPDELVALGTGLYEALEAIHHQGIVHRDLKPGNVMMVDGHPVVIDFGIAQVADDVRLTMTGMVMGTPGYLSPEVVEGAEVTDATDWWGWAATLAFAASGQAPFGRGPMVAVLDRVTRGKGDLSGVDPQLEPLLSAALATDPQLRPPAGEVIAALRLYAQRRPVTQALTQRTPQGAPGRTGASRPGPRQVFPGADPTMAMPSSSTRVQPEQYAPPQDWQPDPPQGWAAEPRRGSLPAAGWGDPPPQRPDWAPPEHGVDPRIGQHARSGTLAALLAVFLGICAAAPVVGWSLLLIWSVIARTSDHVVTSMVLRRHEAGYRRSDTAVALAMTPWHTLRGIFSTVLSMLLPVAFALATLIVSAAGLSAAGTLNADINHPVPVLLGSALGAVIAWWGPGGMSLRRGSRTVVRTVVPGRGVAQVVAGVLAAVGVVLIVLALSSWPGGAVTWWPTGTQAPFQHLIPQILQP